MIEEWIAANQDRFDSRSVVEAIFAAVDQRYEEWIVADQDRFDARSVVETIFVAVDQRYE